MAAPNSKEGASLKSTKQELLDAYHELAVMKTTCDDVIQNYGVFYAKWLP